MLDFGFGWAHWSRMAMAYGCRVSGVELSQERADEVAAQLIELGVSASKLEIRAHGNRYPLLNSQGKPEQANRRVSVRLIRSGTQQGAE